VQDLSTLDNDAYDQVIGGETFHVLRTASWISKDSTSGPCDGGAGKFVAYKRVNVKVSWNQMNGVKPVRSDTIITPGVGSYDPTLGNIAVKVLDRGTATVSGVNVTVVSGGMSKSEITGDDGCAFFVQLQPGSWTVAASTTGYVDQQGVATPTLPTSVSAGNPTPIQVTYDKASSLTVSVGDSTHPVVPAALTLNNALLQPSGSKSFAGTGGSRTVTGLFPFTAGYTGWLGSCSDADPEAKQSGTAGPLYPGATRGTAATMTPGANSPLVAKAASVRVMLSRGGFAAPGYTVTAIHAAGDATCPSGESWNLGTTAADGSVKATLPFGTWSIRVSDGGPDVPVTLSAAVTNEVAVAVAR
jgi:hypothetical protein